MESKVYCYYKKDRPFLKLAPFKVEILRFDPLVVLFKDVLADDEIAVIKELATPRVSLQKMVVFKYPDFSFVVPLFKTLKPES